MSPQTMSLECRARLMHVLALAEAAERASSASARQAPLPVVSPGMSSEDKESDAVGSPSMPRTPTPSSPPTTNVATRAAEKTSLKRWESISMTRPSFCESLMLSRNFTRPKPIARAFRNQSTNTKPDNEKGLAVLVNTEMLRIIHSQKERLASVGYIE